MTTLAILFCVFIAFKLGMGFERWTSGRMDDMGQAFNAGHDEGYSEGYRDGYARSWK